MNVLRYPLFSMNLNCTTVCLNGKLKTIIYTKQMVTSAKVILKDKEKKILECSWSIGGCLVANWVTIVIVANIKD